MRIRRFNIGEKARARRLRPAGGWEPDPLIEHFPIPTWVEDFSAVKAFFDALKAGGTTDFRAYFESHPEAVQCCAEKVKILAINQAGRRALDIHGPRNLPQRITEHFADETWPVFCEEMIVLAEGGHTFRQEVSALNLVNTGGINLVDLYLFIPPDSRDTMRQVLVTFVDLTERKRVERELRQSEERYRSLFEGSPIGVSISRGGVQLYANPAYIHMFGFENIAEMAGSPITELVIPEHRALVLDRSIKRDRGLPEETHYEVTGLRRDHSTFLMQLDVTQVQMGDDLASMAFIQDITARKATEEVERQERILAESLRDTAAALNSNLDFDQVLDSILDNARRVLPHHAIDIMLVDPQGIARIIRSRGYAEQGSEALLSTISLPVSGTPNLRQMAATAQPIIIPDVQSNPDWIRMDGMDWVRSYAGMPVRQKDTVIGFINLSSTTPDFYRPDQIDRLRAFADQVAIAFTNARLVDELQKANERLQAQLSEIQILENELREQAIRDPLTGLFNRRYLKEILDREILRANREGMQVSIIVMDVDFFKQVNDTAGHEAGDLMLKAISRQLEKSIRSDDIACRYGGEEFVIVMPGASLLIAEDRAERIRFGCEALSLLYEDQDVRTSMSLGVAAYPMHGASGEEVLIRADRALYIAKQSGRNRVVVYRETMRTPFAQAKYMR